jgi:hypothetical protein
MKYVVLFVLMGGITALANWPALLGSLPTISKARTV